MAAHGQADSTFDEVFSVVVHVSDITSGKPEAIAATLKRAVKKRASLFLVVCIDDATNMRNRPGTLETIINETNLSANGAVPSIAQLRVGDLRMDRNRCEVIRGTRSVRLSPLEYNLLEFLMLHHDRALSDDVIMRSVFQKASKGRRCNALWVYIHRLRGKIDHRGDVPLIHTIKGRGYILKSPS